MLVRALQGDEANAKINAAETHNTDQAGIAHLGISFSHTMGSSFKIPITGEMPATWTFGGMSDLSPLCAVQCEGGA
jgi:hypothetical protein